MFDETSDFDIFFSWDNLKFKYEFMVRFGPALQYDS